MLQCYFYHFLAELSVCNRKKKKIFSFKLVPKTLAIQSRDFQMKRLIQKTEEILLDRVDLWFTNLLVFGKSFFVQIDN